MSKPVAKKISLVVLKVGTSICYYVPAFVLASVVRLIASADTDAATPFVADQSVLWFSFLFFVSAERLAVWNGLFGLKGIWTSRLWKRAAFIPCAVFIALVWFFLMAFLQSGIAAYIFANNLPVPLAMVSGLVFEALLGCGGGIYAIYALAKHVGFRPHHLTATNAG